MHSKNEAPVVKTMGSAMAFYLKKKRRTKMKKVLSVLLCIVLLASTMLLSVGCGSSDGEGGENEESSGIVIGVSNGTTGNAFRTGMVESATAYLEELKAQGVIEDYIVSNTNDANDQVAGITDMINRGVDLIVSTVDNGQVLAPVFQEAIDNGIMIISGGCEGVELGPLNISMEENSYDFCALPTEYLAYEMGYKGGIVHLYGLEGGWAAGEERKQAVRDVAKKYNMEIIASAPCLWMDAEATKAVTSLLATNGEAYGGENAMVMHEDVANGAYQAYKTAGVDLKYINGLYTYGWLRTWDADKDLVSCVVPYRPDISVDWINLGLLLLTEGYEIDNSKLTQDYKIYLPVSEIIVRDEPAGDEPWLECVPEDTKVVTLAEALEGNEDKSDNDCIMGAFDKQFFIDNYLKKAE